MLESRRSLSPGEIRLADQSSWDVSQSTIAVVIQPPAPPLDFGESDLRSLMRPPFSIVQGSTGENYVSSTRDQLEVIFSPTKINVRDLSGRGEFSDSRIPEILHMFVRKYGTPIRSFGINFVILVPKPDPQGWIRRVLLNPRIEGASKLPVIGGQVLVSLRADPKTWNIKFQRAQDNSGIEVNFNASEDTHEIPVPDVLRKSMDEQLSGLRELMHNLDSVEVE